MRTHPHLVHPRQQSYISQQQPHQQQSSYMKPQKSAQEVQQHYGMQDPYSKTHKRPLGGAPYLPQQRSFSSSEEELRSTPEFEGEFYACFLLSTFHMRNNFYVNFNAQSFYFLSRQTNKRKLMIFKRSPPCHSL